LAGGYGCSQGVSHRQAHAGGIPSEFYNIFNHPQLGQPQATFNRASTSGFGSIITPIDLDTAIVSPITPVRSGTPRKMQFTLRLQF
jgi:hypothetical protein